MKIVERTFLFTIAPSAHFTTTSSNKRASSTVRNVESADLEDARTFSTVIHAGYAFQSKCKDLINVFRIAASKIVLCA